MEHEQVENQARSGGDRVSAPRLVIAALGRGRLIGALLSVAVVLIVLSLKWGGGAAFLLGLLTASVFGVVDGRVSVTAGILCVACCPLGLIAQDGAWLQQSSLVNYYAASVGIYSFQNVTSTVITWAFYLLCIGTMGRIVQYVAARTRGDNLYAEAA